MTHQKDDRYMLQIFDSGRWKDVDWTTKSKASREARERTKKLGKAHRVINVDAGNQVLVETSLA